MLSGIKLFKALVIHLIDIMCTLKIPDFNPAFQDPRENFYFLPVAHMIGKR